MGLAYGESSRINLIVSSTFFLVLLLKCNNRGRSLDRRDCAVKGTESRNAIKSISYSVLDLFISCCDSDESDDEKSGTTIERDAHEGD
jgi:hypothetical protein